MGYEEYSSIRGGDRSAAMALTIGSAGRYGLPFLPFLPRPDLECWPFLFASVLLHQLYFATLVSAYGYSDLSRIYSLARSTAPILVALAAWLLVGEALVLLQFAGLVIV